MFSPPPPPPPPPFRSTGPVTFLRFRFLSRSKNVHIPSRADLYNAVRTRLQWGRSDTHAGVCSIYRSRKGRHALRPGVTFSLWSWLFCRFRPVRLRGCNWSNTAWAHSHAARNRKETEKVESNRARCVLNDHRRTTCEDIVVEILDWPTL